MVRIWKLHPQLIQLAPSRDRWYINKKSPPCKKFLLVTWPNCVACAALTRMLTEVQDLVGIIIYVVELGNGDIYAEELHRELGISNFPQLFIVNNNNILKSVIPHLLSYDPEDPSGVSRLDVNTLLEFAL